MSRTVSVAFRPKGKGPLHWIDCSAETALDAYRLIQSSDQVKRLLSEGYREYGIIGLSRFTWKGD